MNPVVMRLSAPAKINLHLRVAPPGTDGFHPLLSWMCTVGLFDTLEISAPASIAPSEIQLSCNVPDLACDESNLIVRAGRALAESTGNPSLTARIHLTKRIPIGGGLGGGSSDAAATLQGLNRLWDLRKSAEELSSIASQLGSDVPFFLHGPSCIARGRGEVLQRIDPPRARWALLILPEISMPTPAVYRKFDEMNLGQDLNAGEEPQWQDWIGRSANQLSPKLINDLEVPAFALASALGQLRADLEQFLSRVVRMSGSGSTLFTLFDDRDAAELAATAARRLCAKSVVVDLAPAMESQLQRLAEDS
jgi:4-diphosphocytidyl-2-C-methyl-D-erythritol kinase